jgi:hypothetical protein
VGVSITRHLDRILVTRPTPDLFLKPGDIHLRSHTLGEGFADTWAKDVWRKKYGIEATEKDGTGCRGKDECNSVVIEGGIKEWWVQAKTIRGNTRWVLATNVTPGEFWDSGNLDNLCAV